MWILKVYRDLKSNQDKFMEEKSTKADLYRVPPVAQRITELQLEPGRIYWESAVKYLPNFYINFRHLLLQAAYWRQQTCRLTQ